jgi:hypothetical protein
MTISVEELECILQYRQVIAHLKAKYAVARKKQDPELFMLWAALQDAHHNLSLFKKTMGGRNND